MKGFSSRSYEMKLDGSVVTETDRAIEVYFREQLPKIVPGAAIWGEEYGFDEPTEEGLWVIDPIDGTSNFAFGIPLWGITAALFQNGEMQIGVMSLPCQGITVAAAKGHGAWENGVQLPKFRPGKIEPMELIGIADSSEAFTYPYPGKMRHFGSFVVESVFFCTGRLRMMTTDGVKLYDCGTGVLAARELGAEIVHHDGRPMHESEWTKPTPMEPFVFLPPDSGIKL